jgi:hypothetical protein
LPKNTFRRFTAIAGLYADVEKQAKCRLEIAIDGASVFRTKMLTPKDVAKRVDIDISRCRQLRLLAVTDGSTERLAYPIWGEPTLRKRPWKAGPATQ